MRVADVMASDLVKVSPDETISSAGARLKESAGEALLVVDDAGKVVGLVTALLLLEANRDPGDPVKLAMETQVTTVSRNAGIRELQDLVESRSGPVVVLNADGTAAGILSTGDMMRVFAKEQRRMEIVYRNILDQIDEGIVAIDPEGLIALFNSKWLNIHKVTGEQVLGQHVCVNLPESSLIEVLQRGEPLVREEVHFEKTGASVRASYKPIFDTDHSIIGSVAIVRNLTEIKELSLQLRSLKSLGRSLAIIFDNLSEGIFATTADLKIAYVNAAFSRILDLSGGQAAGESLVHDGIRSMVRRTMEEGGPVNETLVNEEHGQRLWVNCIPLFVGNVVSGALGIIEDLTEIVELNQKLERAHQFAEYLEVELIKERNLPSAFSMIIGQSGKLRDALAVAAKAAMTSSTVLLLGENGVGKEQVAKAIHYSSPRKDGPFICLNCSAIPDPLLESELFGYDEGAFTGAKRGGKPGKFELAHGGTLLLDEIGDMSPQMQAKLLRVLQEMEIERVGGTATRRVDVRIIAATHRNVKNMVERGEFREDLFYRVNVVTVTIPPLRERKEDILPLIQFFLEQYNRRNDRNVLMSSQVVEILQGHDWPGNVRELKNAVELATVMVDGDLILPEHLPNYLLMAKTTCPTAPPIVVNATLSLSEIVEEAEKQAILKALEAANQNRTRAMEILKISRRSFYNKFNEYYPAGTSKKSASSVHFMLPGDLCTRNCRLRGVKKGKAGVVAAEERDPG